jgi:hypothetical protein
MSAQDLPDRLAEYDGDVTVVRVALDEGDVANTALPGFDVETKRLDSRYRWFRRHYGTRCVELDALNPIELRRRIEAEIVAFIDAEVWRRCAQVEAAEQESMQHILDQWREAAG